MGKLDVDPARLAGAGRSLDSKTDALASAVQALETALSSSGQMCGNDAAGKVFALSYRQGGQGLFSAAEAAVNACRNVGYGIEVSASNYAQSEAASTLGGGEPSVRPPSQPSKFSGPTMPNPFGPAVGEPLLWAIVREFVGSPWPDGNPATLRAAAGAWRSFGGAMAGVSGAVGGCSAEVTGHDIPEMANIVSAVTKLGSGVGDVEKQCESIASSLDSFAGEVEASQQAIRDLLHQLSLSGVLEELGRIFSGHNPMDDVKRVANDIKVVLHTLGREADASSSMFKMAISELDSLTTEFENWTRKEFTHFLGNPVGNAVADLYNSDVDILEGGVKSLMETVGSLGDLATHPQQLLDLAKQANPEYLIAKFVADPRGAFEHSLDVVKGLVDAKDWNSDHPLRGLGDNIGTGLQFFIPGAGEAKAGAEGARAADEAAQAAKADGKLADGLLGGGLKSDVVGQSSRITHDLDGIKATPAEPGAVKPADPGAVKPADPAPGRPSDLGAAKPAEPGAVKPAEPGPGPTAKPSDPGAAKPAEPAPIGSTVAPAEHAPAAAPHSAPDGSPVEHAAGSPHSMPESHPGGADAHGGAPHDPGGHGGGGDGGGSAGDHRGGGDHGGVPNNPSHTGLYDPPVNHGVAGDRLPDLTDINNEFRLPSGEVDPDRLGEWAQKISDEYPSISKDGVEGVYDYTTENYDGMNPYLRNIDPLSPLQQDILDAESIDQLTDSQRLAWEDRISHTDDGLSALPPYRADPADPFSTTWRGMRAPDALLDQFVEGGIFSDPAYLSTSLDSKVAETFALGAGANQIPTLLRVDGFDGVDVMQLSRYMRESEILFPRGSEFNVLLKELGPDGIWRIILKQVPR